MPRTELIRRLAELNPPTPAACLVLLWTYFEDDRVGLSAVESLIGELFDHRLKLPGHALQAPVRDGLAAVRKALEEIADEERFDVFALQVLKGIDLFLKDRAVHGLETGPLAGMDGKPYLLRPRNAFLSQRFTDAGRSVRWAKHQSLSLAAYCPNFVVVPCDPVKGLQIESRSTGDWGSPYLHDRLRAESENLRIMLWPLEIHPDYPGLEGLASGQPPEFLELASPRNEHKIQEEALRAVRTARKEKVTLLIFPELILPPGTEEEVRLELRREGADGYPILTLAGCCHRLNTTGRLHLNEAVLLGPDGFELHRHRKLAAFTDYRFGEGNPAGENLETGTRVTVLESCLGNLTPLICLDLLNDTVGGVLRRCHGNLLIVPSMSEETQAHRHHALTHQIQRLASTFVCNHWFSPLSERSTSFYRLPRQQGLSIHWSGKDYEDSPFLLFDLLESLSRQ